MFVKNSFPGKLIGPSFISGPGGYMQWLETDVIDVWATSSIKIARGVILGVIHEKIALGLVVS